MVEIRPASQLFNLRTSAEALQLGTFDLAWTDLGSLGNWYPPLGFTAMPFLFGEDFDHAYRVLYGPVGEQARGEVRERLGVDILSLGGVGVPGVRDQAPRPLRSRRAGDQAPGSGDPRVRRDGPRAGDESHADPGRGDLTPRSRPGVVDMSTWRRPPTSSSRPSSSRSHKNVTRTYHIMTEVSLMASVKRLSALSSGAPGGGPGMPPWTSSRAGTRPQNMKVQEAAWQSLTQKMQANATPDIVSFQSKMGPVIESFVAKVGPKGRPDIDAVRAAQ